MAKKTVRHKKPIKITITKSNRRKIDPETGREISRHAYDKKYGRKRRTGKNYTNRSFQRKVRLYKAVRNDYIERHRARLLANKKYLRKDGGINIQAVQQDAELKKIIRDLHSKDPKKKAAALERTGRIDADQIELYVEKFATEE